MDHKTKRTVLVHDAVESSDSVIIVQSTSDNIMSTKPAVQTNTASAAAATTTTVNDTTTAATATATATITAGETSSSSATGTVSRQWASANRRRPAQSRRPVRSSSNQDAAEKISAVANIQADYYKEKLKMKQQQHELFLVEHAKRMHVLDLQEQLTVKQLRKFDE